jgi:PIN domain nuclease of toxin-antitoxin system
MPFEELRQHVLINGFDLLPITFQHTFNLCSLDNYHKDPFDRIIITQACTENLTVISKDSNFASYKKLQLVW